VQKFTLNTRKKWLRSEIKLTATNYENKGTNQGNGGDGVHPAVVVRHPYSDPVFIFSAARLHIDVREQVEVICLASG
jgi:hypothetical protein